MYSTQYIASKLIRIDIFLWRAFSFLRIDRERRDAGTRWYCVSQPSFDSRLEKYEGRHWLVHTDTCACQQEILISGAHQCLSQSSPSHVDVTIAYDDDLRIKGILAFSSLFFFPVLLFVKMCQSEFSETFYGNGFFSREKFFSHPCHQTQPSDLERNPAALASRRFLVQLCIILAYSLFGKYAAIQTSRVSSDKIDQVVYSEQTRYHSSVCEL